MIVVEVSTGSAVNRSVMNIIYTKTGQTGVCRRQSELFLNPTLNCNNELDSQERQ
jgi:hypothetical protein